MELRIHDVSKTYPNGVQALKDVTLTIPAGMYGLLGPKGAGKSTLMRILASLEEPDAGSLRLGDLDMLTQRDELRTSVRYLSLDAGIHDKISAETLLHGPPKLIIVDEPSAGLDPSERLRLLKLLSGMGENTVVIHSTHTVEHVSELCTRMAVLNEGRILFEAEPLRAIGDLCGRIWSRVIAKEAVPRVQREYAVISTKLLAGRTVVRVFSNTAPAVGFEGADPDLEDVYLSALAGHLRTSTTPAGSDVANETGERATRPVQPA